MLDLLHNHRDELTRLCRDHHVRRLELFGSAAEGRFDPASSDLDFLVEFAELPPSQRADAYFGLLHGLEDLFRRHIDLVTVEALANRWFVDSIAPSRTMLYAA